VAIRTLPARETWSDLPEFKAVTADVDSQPEHRHVTHFVGADEADECAMLLNQSFVSVMFGSSRVLPAYDKWVVAEDMTTVFRRHADNVRLIGADEPHRRWLLKNPSHLLGMRELFEVFPEARVVWMHRDPKEAMGSLVDLLSVSSSDLGFGSDHGPGEKAGRELPFRMRRWLEQNPQGKHGAHRYDPADLGVTDEAVQAHYAPYMARYGLG
jgi:hypothetical protein